MRCSRKTRSSYFRGSRWRNGFGGAGASWHRHGHTIGMAMAAMVDVKRMPGAGRMLDGQGSRGKRRARCSRGRHSRVAIAIAVVDVGEGDFK